MKPGTETANRPTKRRARRVARHEARRHLAALKLSPRAYAIQQECFAATDFPIYREIARRIQEATGEVVTIQQLSRGYHGYWKGHLAAISERAERRLDAIALLKSKYKLGEPMADRILTDLLNQAILLNERPLADADPVALLREQTRRERVDVERKRVEVEAKKVEMKVSQAEASAKPAEKKKSSGLTDEAADQIRRKVLTGK